MNSTDVWRQQLTWYAFVGTTNCNKNASSAAHKATSRAQCHRREMDDISVQQETEEAVQQHLPFSSHVSFLALCSTSSSSSLTITRLLLECRFCFGRDTLLPSIAWNSCITNKTTKTEKHASYQNQIATKSCVISRAFNWLIVSSIKIN